MRQGEESDVELSGQKFTVSGVLPQGFNYPRGAEFLVPLAPPSAAWAMKAGPWGG